MRLFIALELAEHLREKVAEIEASLKQCEGDVKFVEPENLHFTLKFLGETPEEFLPKVKEGIERAIWDVKQFNISLEGVGYFGSPKYLRTIWVGVKEGQDKVHEIMARLNNELDKFKKDTHKPNAHLTVGRVKSSKGRECLLEKMADLSDVKVGEMAVKEIVLKQSVLSKEGPAYSDVKVFPLSP